MPLITRKRPDLTIHHRNNHLTTHPNSSASIEKDVASVKQAAVKASLASLLEGLSAEERKQVLSGL